MSAATAAQTRPTDLTIPHSMDTLVPEVGLYRKLLDAERRVDILTARKFGDVTESLGKLPRKKELLRIFIYNTAENQPWQTGDASGSGNGNGNGSGSGTGEGGAASAGEPSWTLRIEGRLVGEKDLATRKKFSSLITGVAVDMLSSDAAHAQAPEAPEATHKNIVEWHEPQDPKASAAEFDGLDIKRPGAENVRCKITIQPREYPLLLKTSSALRDVVGVAETTQHDAVFAVWQYIQLNNLQSPDDKRMINCDEPLSTLFGVPRFNFKEIIQLLSKHLAPNKPVVVEYEVRCDRASTLGELVIDVEVPLEDVAAQDQLKADSKRLVTEHDDAIKELGSKVALGVQALQSAHRKHTFYDRLAQNPVEFFREFTESHAKLLKILSGDEGYTEDAVRRAAFYTDELLQENVDVLLKTNRM